MRGKFENNAKGKRKTPLRSLVRPTTMDRTYLKLSRVELSLVYRKFHKVFVMLPCKGPHFAAFFIL